MMRIQQVVVPQPVNQAVEAELDQLPVTPIAETIPRAVPDRATKGVRSGPAPAQYRAPDSGEGLWRPTRFNKTPARPVGEDRDGKTQRPARTASADQAGIRTGADMEEKNLSRHGDGRWFCP